MEAVKPKKKHKKKTKGSAFQSPQGDQDVHDVKEDSLNVRPDHSEAEARTETSEDTTFEGAERLVGEACTSGLTEINTPNDRTTNSTLDDCKGAPQDSTDQTSDLFQAGNNVEVAANDRESQDGAAAISGTLDAPFRTSSSVAPCLDGNGYETRFGPTGPQTLERDPAENEIPVTDQNLKTSATKESEQSDMQALNKDLQSLEDKESVKSSELSSSDRVLVNKNSGNLPQDASAEKSMNENVEASPMYPNLDSLTRETVSSTSQYRPTLEAFSEDYLKTFYFNPLLEQMEGFVDHFIKISKQEDHEFYELVNTYFRGRNALAMAFKEYEIVLSECEKKKEEVWITKDFTVAAQGRCLDQVTVTHNHSYQQVELNRNLVGEIDESFKTMQKALHETLALQKYTCQMARLHIDTYIHDMLQNSALLRSVASDMLVTEQCPVDMNPEVQEELQKLRDCISVLFMFVRQPIQDNEFVQIVNAWIEQLVAVLLRVASLADLVFLMNHIMRCPPGYPNKIAHLIQFPMPQFKGQGYSSVGEHYYWDNPLVHHFVAMLAAVLRPIREREEFLEKLHVGKKATLRSISWTLVDEDGESLEDEDPETSWVLIQEVDLIGVFSQFPFDAIFKHLLKMDPNVPNDCLSESHYHVEHTTSRDIMRMLAFGSCVVYIMGNAFHTYRKIRYRGFVKRVGRTIRQVVQYVLDHWSGYRSWRVNVCGETEHSPANAYISENQISLNRLQVEVDQFFLRAALQIISAHRLGAWQFLADMPFSSVSSDTLWKLFWALHSDVAKLESLANIEREQAFRDDWREELPSRSPEFCDQLAKMTQSEAIFLLTTFANMAISRNEKEREFIEAISLEVYEVSFIASQTREMCSKTGRHLLGTITAVHPFVLSVLLERVSETISIIGKACVYLFTGLPVHLWHPTYKNMDSIRSWLLKADLSSPEHQLARYVISNMNWGHVGEPGESDHLFLHKCLHRAVAVTLVEVSALRLPNLPGGISHEAFREDKSLLKQVTMLAASSYSRMTQPGHEQQLYDWLWEVLLILRLHAADLPTPVMQFTQALPNEDELQASEDSDPGFASLVKTLSSESLELSSEKALTNMCHSIKAGGPIACYAAVVMTTIGASQDQFLGAGLDHMTTIMNEKCYDAVFKIVANVVPLFFGCPEKLTEEARFVSVIHRISQLDNDNAGYAEKLLQASTAGEYCKRLSGIIHSHVQKFQAPGSKGPICVVEFWMQTLCSLPNWYRDPCVQFLLDNVIKSVVRVDGGLAVIQTRLMDAYKMVLKESGGQGVIASILSWVTSSGNVPPVLWDIKATPDYSYYAYSVLCNETQLEEESGFSVELSRQLLKKPGATVEAALRKVVKVMKLTWQPPLSQLSIYRWANQALVTDMDHPMLPLIWQRFFSLYLQRPVIQPGLAQRAGVGYRFFDASTYLSMLKKMKHRLRGTAEHHRNKSMDAGADRDTLRDGDSEITKQFEHVRAFHEKLSGYYQTLALWLDEPRLHDPSLFLPSLPAPYDPTRLETLLKPEQVPWTDLLYDKKIDWEVMESVRCWVKQALGPHRKPVNSQMTGQWSDRDPETAASRIIRRMKIHPPALPPPPVTKTQRILSHLLDGTLMNRQKILNIVYTQILGMVAQARKFCGLVNHHISLDIEYIDLVPKMYSNEMSQVVVQVPCRSKFFKDGYQCKGPATLTIKFLAKRINEVVVRKIAENRNEQEQVIQNFIQPCPSSLCEAAAYVEVIITSLVNKAKASTERRTQEILNDIGTGLFYQISGIIDDNVLNYQPTIQFFTLCIEILGKAFILHNGSQTEQLLSAILEHTSVTMLLVPYFCPNDNPGSFISMYQRILDTADDDLVFSLLSKFDVGQWLSSTGSNFNERRALTTIVFNALNSLGYEPTDKQRLILDMYLRHLSIAMMYNFPEQYGDALRQLCEGSSKRTLCLHVWNTFLSCIGCVPTDESQPPNPSTDILGEEQVLETLVWLTKYFNDQRAELGGHVTGGLYTMWRPYITQLSFILGFMCQQIIERRAAVVYANKGQGLETALGELWSLVCSVFHPWMCSQESPVPGNPPVAPWTESEVPQASDMVALYTDSLRCLHSHLNAPHSGTSLMNVFWHYFVSSLAKEGIPDYVLRVYHSKFFQLPWESFFPTLQNMQLMQEVYSLCKSSFRFLGIVFPRFDWNKIVAAYCENQTNEAISTLHASLFHLLVMFSNEKSIMGVQGSEMPALLGIAQSFAWHYLDGRSFDQVVTWQVEHYLVASVLQERSNVWFALRLIRAAAGIVRSEDGSMQPTRPDTAAKRASYVRCVASLLCKCSTSKIHEAKSYSPAVVFVLKDIESVAGSGCDPASTASEVCMMMSEALNMLNNCSPVGDVLSVILDVILQFIRDSSCTMLVLASLPAACRTLASIKFMVSVLETGIQSFFAKHSTPIGTPHAATDAVENGGWEQIVPGLAAPDLAQDEFVQECIRQGALLTLYTNVLQKLATCQTPHQEMTILTDMFTWAVRLKVRPEFEWKLVLLWHKILQLSLRQVWFASGPLNELTKQLSFLASNLHSLGEDKDSSGLFGAIGFGKKSLLSVKFRFICRALECFLLAQMPSNSLLRLEAKAPGYVREPKSTRQLTAGGRAISSTTEAEQALVGLESLRSNKLYINLTEHIMAAYSFIANPLHSLKDGPQFVANLVRRLFPDEKALLIVA